MKTTIITTRHRPQDDRIYFKQALSLAKYLEVSLIAPQVDEELSWPDTVGYIPIPSRTGLISRFWSLIDVFKIVKKENPDFCHLHDLDLVLIIPFLRWFTDVKVIYDSHEAYPEQIGIREQIPRSLRPFAAWFVNFVEKSSSKLAHHIITADEPTSASFRKYNMPVETVFNFPDLNSFATLETVQKYRQKSMKSKHKTLVYHGSMCLDRGLLEMVEALGILKLEGFDVSLKLVGQLNEELKELVDSCAKKHQVSDSMQFTGWVEYTAIQSELLTSDFGIVPLQPNEKYKRNIPIKIFEYMACGIPMIAADLPPIRRFLDLADCGLIFDSTKPEKLAESVATLINDPDRYMAMSQNGYDAVLNKWNWNNMEDVLVSVYKSLKDKQ